MEVLLEQEIEERSRTKTKTSSLTSQTGQTSQASTTAEASDNREETKADMLFNTDNGKCAEI